MKKIYMMMVSALSICVLFGCKKNNAEVTILFTNDVHGEINAKKNYASIKAMKDELVNDGKNVLLFDAGDHISGGYYTNYDSGISMVKLMNTVGYDAATLGNHEFDYNFSHLEDIMNQAKYPYISTNLYHMYNNTPTSRFTSTGSKVFSFNNNFRIGVIGASTPDSITTSTPSHFQDDKGNYIYTFRENDIYDVMQNEIDTIRNKCDYVICLSHLGDEDQNKTFTASKLAKNTHGIDVIIDGHTHIPVEGIKVKDKNNKDVLITQAGGKFINIGKMTLNKNGEIKNELISSYDKKDSNVQSMQNFIMNELDARLAKKIAKTDIDFTHKRSNETNLGDLCAESPYYYYNIYLPQVKHETTSCDVSISNSGGIRVENVDKGVWTLKTCRNIHNFGNGVALVKMKGSLLRTMLEFSSYKLPSYFGGLLQISGVKYTCNTSITSDIVVDSNSNYVSGPSESHRRLSSIQIYNRNNQTFENLNDDKDYYVGGNSYTLLNSGDGFSMLKNAEHIRTETDVVDYQVLAEYLSNFKKNTSDELPTIANSNSPLSTAYPNLRINYTDEGFGQRINIVNE